MDKIIKKIKTTEYIYELGYDLIANSVCPRINIFRGENYIGKVCLDFLTKRLFEFSLDIDYSYSFNFYQSIEELFEKLRLDIDIPKEVEKEYENIFILYKLNNFKEV